MADIKIELNRETEFEQIYDVGVENELVAQIIVDTDGNAMVESTDKRMADAALSSLDKARAYVEKSFGEQPQKSAAQRAKATAKARSAPKGTSTPKEPKTPKVAKEKVPAAPRVRREITEAQAGRIRLRFNQVQTAALTPEAGSVFSTPTLGHQLEEAIAERQYYKDDTMVIYVLPELAHAILEWNDNQEGLAFKAGGRALRSAMEKQGVQPRELATEKIAV
jgi:hypothetical protein